MIITKLVVVIIKECVEKAREKTCRRRRKSCTICANIEQCFDRK